MVANNFIKNNKDHNEYIYDFGRFFKHFEAEKKEQIRRRKVNNLYKEYMRHTSSATAKYRSLNGRFTILNDGLYRFLDIKKPDVKKSNFEAYQPYTHSNELQAQLQ